MAKIYHAPPQPGDEDARWAEASRRVRHQIEHGPRVRGLSTQLALLILIAVMGGLTVATRAGEPITTTGEWQIGLFAAALVLAAIGYARAKRMGRLLPQIPTLRSEWPLAPLLPEERRTLGKQLRGRLPATGRSRQLVQDLIANARRNNHATWTSLAGMFCWMLSATLFLGWPWPLSVAGLVVFVFVMT